MPKQKQQPNIIDEAAEFLTELDSLATATKTAERHAREAETLLDTARRNLSAAQSDYLIHHPDAELDDLDGQVFADEPDTADLHVARQQYAHAQAKLDRCRAGLGGLRRRQLEHDVALLSIYDRLEEHRQQFTQQAAQQFYDEIQPELEILSRLKAKQQAMRDALLLPGETQKLEQEMNDAMKVAEAAQARSESQNEYLAQWERSPQSTEKNAYIHTVRDETRKAQQVAERKQQQLRDIQQRVAAARLELPQPMTTDWRKDPEAKKLHKKFSQAKEIAEKLQAYKRAAEGRMQMEERRRRSRAAFDPSGVFEVTRQFQAYGRVFNVGDKVSGDDLDYELLRKVYATKALKLLEKRDQWAS